MTTRLVAILGLGNKNVTEGTGYKPVTYGAEGRAATQTSLVTRAICELFGPVDSVVLLGTQDVQAMRVATGAVEGELGRGFCFVTIPTGESEGDRWRLFTLLQRALDLAPIAEAGERESPTRILFDVTHGYRTQPLFAMSVLSYLQSEWARRGEEAPEVRVLYGAFDAAPPGQPAPLWDLTQQLTVTRWNAALDALMRYGRADDLEALARADSAAQSLAARSAGASGSALAETGVAKRFGALARAFADDLAVGRFASLLTGVRDPRRPEQPVKGTAAKLREFLQSDEAARLTARVPVLRDSVARLDAWLAPLRARRIESAEGAAALASLALLCARLQRYAESVAATREGLVTLHALGRGEPVAGEPNLPGYHAARDAAERAIDREGTDVVERAFRNVGGPRNDLLHGGLNNQPRSASALREEAGRLAEEFARLVAERRP